jgi:hypothetical protein
VWSYMFVDTAVAQTARRPLDRPYRALFGHGNQGNEGQLLNVSAVVAEAYDDNLLAEGGGLIPGAATLTGRYSMFLGSAEYAWMTQRVQLGVTAASAFRYYGQVGDVISVSQSAGVGLSAELSKRFTLAVNESFAYSPSYLSRLFPGVADQRLGDTQPASPNYAATDTSSYSYVTAVSLSHGVSRHGQLSIAGNYTLTDFNSAALLRQGGASYGGQAKFSRTLGRRSAFNTGYHYTAGDYGFAAVGKSTEHGVDFGFEHTKVLSATRNAVYSVNVGAARAVVPPVVLSGSQTQTTVTSANDRLYRMTGDGSVGYQFSRTGEFRASYRRGVEYVVELTQPVFIDGVALSVTTSPARRVDVIAGAGYSSGASALLQTSRFSTYTADIQTHYRINQMFSAYAEYIYYVYDFSKSPLLAPTLPRQLERNGVRVGLAVSAPLIRR